MKLVITIGVIISLLGLTGLLKCVLDGLRIKRIEKSENYSPEELKGLLGKLYVLNMLSLSSSFAGLIIIIVGTILDT